MISEGRSPRLPYICNREILVGLTTNLSTLASLLLSNKKEMYNPISKKINHLASTGSNVFKEQKQSLQVETNKVRANTRMS